MADDSIPKRPSLEAPLSPRMSSSENPKPENTKPEGTKKDQIKPRELKPYVTPVLDEISQLAALFSEHGGGHFSQEFSANLALEIVLNEIVEQACLATGATGAAIFLWRDEEMVCRASSGTTAPGLGTRLDLGSTIAGECIQTRQVQRCDDTEGDPRADSEISRALGAQSVMLLPLLRGRELVGIFAAFSDRIAAFGDRDQQTLEAFTYLVIKNIEKAEKPVEVLPELHAVGDAQVSIGQAEPVRAPAEVKINDASMGEIFSEPFPPPRRFDFAVAFLGFVVLGSALLLGTKLALRFGWIQPVHLSRVKTQAATEQQQSDVKTVDGNASSNSAQTASSPQSSNSPATATKQPIPLGSMRVYEDGVEVFRTHPLQSNADPPRDRAEGDVQQAAQIESERTIWLAPAMVEDGLVYRVEPEYPEEARESKIEGPVVLEIRIDHGGTVQETKLVSGNAILAQAAIDAVKQWRFKPRSIHGNPVEMDTTVTLNFRLQR
jgi:TonB family protein